MESNAEAGRPSLAQPAVLRPLLEDFARHCGPDLCGGDEEGREHLVEVLLKECRHGIVPDGYDLAKALESAGWAGVDSTMVDELEGLDLYLSYRLQARVAEWVERCAVLPRLAEGAAVNIEHRGKRLEGFIARVQPDLAEYVVRVPSLGHVADGELGTHGLVLPFEQLHDIVQPAADFTLRPQTQRG